MIGDENGMVALLERKIQNHCHDFSLRISNVWCLSHRLNLVVGDMKKMDHIESVFKFADWITKKRRAAAYTRWLHISFPATHLKKPETIQNQMDLLQRRGCRNLVSVAIC